MADYRTDSQKVSEKIKEAILIGKFLPGDRLPQREMAELFSTSTIVAREALRLLDGEGLVVIEPKWGAIVAEVTKEKIWGRYIIREALEGMAARLACINMTENNKIELYRLAERCDQELHEDSLTANEKANLHYDLHAEIVSITKCEELISLINRINLHSILFSNAFHVNWKEDWEGWHKYLIDAIVSKDPDQAEKVMRKHVQRGYQMEIDTLSEA
jgi:DNA-binding GntR family transcriptional regulator